MDEHAKQEIHHLQVWPSGHGYEYRGDPNGPAEQRRLRRDTERKTLNPSNWDAPTCLQWLAEHTEEPNHYAMHAADWAGEVARCAAYEDEAPEEWEARAVDELRAGVVERAEACSWRDGTPDEWREILHSVRALMYQERDVLCCDSGLVDDLLKLAQAGSLGGVADGNLEQAFDGNEIRNLYPDPDEWDAAQCLTWLEEHEESSDTAYRVGDDASSDDALEEVRQAVRDRAEPAEVMEWWRISSWLCDQLHAIGEVTIDNGYGHWWGRCATGQQYIMDGVLQRVGAQFD